MPEELPPNVREEAIAVARRIGSPDEAEDALAPLLAPYQLVPRIRIDGDSAVLVCYPEAWRDEGEIQIEAIDNIDRAIELPLTGAADEAWAEITARNAHVVEQVAEQYGSPHTANARAFATFMENHRARPIAHANDADIEEFLEEYYPRNVWPRAEEAAVIETSVELACQVARDQL